MTPPSCNLTSSPNILSPPLPLRPLTLPPFPLPIPSPFASCYPHTFSISTLINSPRLLLPLLVPLPPRRPLHPLISPLPPLPVPSPPRPPLHPPSPLLFLPFPPYLLPSPPLRTCCLIAPLS